MGHIMVRKNACVYLAAAVIAVMAMGLLLPPAGYAGEPGNESGPVVKKIQDPPEFEAGKVIKSGQLEDFFDATGTVNRVDDKAIILGDRWFEIADDVRMTGISRGDHIGIRLNKNREVVDFERLRDVPH